MPGETPASPRQITNAPFAWCEKAALRLIREAFDNSSFLDQANAVYLAHCELSSDERSPTYDARLNKLADLSGVSRRRVSEINLRLKELKLLDWKQNFIEGTKELAASTFTLFGLSTASTTPRTPRTRSGKNAKRQICPVVEQTIKNVSEQPFKKGEEKTPPASAAQKPVIKKREMWQLIADKKKTEDAINKEKEKVSPDAQILSGLRAGLKCTNDEMRAFGAAVQSQPPPAPIETTKQTAQPFKPSHELGAKFRRDCEAAREAAIEANQP